MADVFSKSVMRFHTLAACQNKLNTIVCWDTKKTEIAWQAAE